MAHDGDRSQPLRRPARVTAVLTALLLLGLAACGSDSKDAEAGGGVTTSTTAAPSGGDDGYGGGGGGTTKDTYIEAKDFSLTSITVAPGSSVKVENAGSATHTVTADDGGFDSGKVAGGASGSFMAPGEYPFHCAIHASMTGTLTVEG